MGAEHYVHWFDSALHAVWGFLGSLLCSKRFFPRSSSLPLSPKFDLIWYDLVWFVFSSISVEWLCSDKIHWDFNNMMTEPKRIRISWHFLPLRGGEWSILWQYQKGRDIFQKVKSWRQFNKCFSQYDTFQWEIVYSDPWKMLLPVYTKFLWRTFTMIENYKLGINTWTKYFIFTKEVVLKYYGPSSFHSVWPFEISQQWKVR